jgi:hypothetical protein
LTEPSFRGRIPKLKRLFFEIQTLFKEKPRMKSSFRKIVFILSALVLTLACGFTNTAKDVAKQGIAERDELVRLAQNVQAASSNFGLVTDTQYAKISVTNGATEGYYEAVAQSGEVWTGNFRSEQKLLEEAMANSQTFVGGDPQKPNLAEQAANGALPSDLGKAFTLFVNSVVQAPPPVPNEKVTLALMDTMNEAMNTIQLAGTDWNDAVRAYNTKRSSVTGEVVAAASDIIGFPLPDNFPYYQSASVGQPIHNPLETPTK